MLCSWMPGNVTSTTLEIRSQRRESTTAGHRRHAANACTRVLTTSTWSTSSYERSFGSRKLGGDTSARMKCSEREREHDGQKEEVCKETVTTEL